MADRVVQSIGGEKVAPFFLYKALSRVVIMRFFCHYTREVNSNEQIEE